MSSYTTLFLATVTQYNLSRAHSCNLEPFSQDKLATREKVCLLADGILTLIGYSFIWCCLATNTGFLPSTGIFQFFTVISPHAPLLSIAISIYAGSTVVAFLLRLHINPNKERELEIMRANNKEMILTTGLFVQKESEQIKEELEELRKELFQKNMELQRFLNQDPSKLPLDQLTQSITDIKADLEKKTSLNEDQVKNIVFDTVKEVWENLDENLLQKKSDLGKYRQRIKETQLTQINLEQEVEKAQNALTELEYKIYEAGERLNKTQQINESKELPKTPSESKKEESVSDNNNISGQKKEVIIEIPNNFTPPNTNSQDPKNNL